MSWTRCKPNNTLDLTAGSHSLAAAGQRVRYAAQACESSMPSGRRRELMGSLLDFAPGPPGRRLLRNGEDAVRPVVSNFSIHTTLANLLLSSLPLRCGLRGLHCAHRPSTALVRIRDR